MITRKLTVTITKMISITRITLVLPQTKRRNPIQLKLK